MTWRVVSLILILVGSLWLATGPAYEDESHARAVAEVVAGTVLGVPAAALLLRELRRLYQGPRSDDHLP